MDFDDPEFKKAFWQWFDNLSTEERRKFTEYRADMAELYFYNKVYDPPDFCKTTGNKSGQKLSFG